MLFLIYSIWVTDFHFSNEPLKCQHELMDFITDHGKNHTICIFFLKYNSHEGEMLYCDSSEL